MDIPNILTRYMPGVEWSLAGREDKATGQESYHLEDLVMHKGHAKPTQQQLEKWAKMYEKESEEEKEKNKSKLKLKELVEEYVVADAEDDQATKLRLKAEITKTKKAV